MSTRPSRGRPDPSDDSSLQSRSLSSSDQSSRTDSVIESHGIRFNSLNKYGDDENLAVEPVRVDLGKRLVAGLVDVMVGYAVQIVVNCIPLINMFVHDQLPMVVFLIIRDALFHGRGVGKNVMGLQVVDVKTGRPASMLQSVKRNMVVFGPYVALYIVNLLLKIMPNEMVTSVVTNVVSGIGTLYTLAVIPYEAWRVYSRADGLRWGDQFAGTATIPADMDFSNPLSK